MHSKHHSNRSITLLAMAGLLAFGSLFLPGTSLAAEKAEGLKCTVIADTATGEVFHRQGVCDQRYSPFSSFKFPLALMGFDSGILQSPQAPIWELKPEYNPSERDLAFKYVSPESWERDSVVWYSQQLTTRMGEQRFNGYVKAFQYGNQDTVGDRGKNNGLTHSWLMSSLTISPDEQVQFLLKFLARSLPVSGQAHDMTLATIPRYPAAGGWTVHGKSGSGWLRDAKGKIDETRPQGWFIGWAEQGDRKVVFARLEIRTQKSDIYGGAKAREDILAELNGLAGGK